MNRDFSSEPLNNCLLPVERPEAPIPGKIYRQVGVRLWGVGAYEREPMDGSQTKYSTLSRVETNDVIVNKIWARNGSVAVVSTSLAGCYVSGEFPTFTPILEKLNPRWFHWFTKTKAFWQQCDEKSQGTSGKNRIRPEKFLEISIPLPSPDEQRRIVARIEELVSRIEEARGLRREAVEEEDLFFALVLNEMRNKLLNSDYSINKLGNITQVSAGGTPSRGMINYWSGTIPWIKTGELIDKDIYQAEEYITHEGLENSSAKLFPPDTVLIALYGQGQTRGRTGRLMMEATTNQACCAILPSKEFLNPRFTQYWLRSLYLEMRKDVRDSVQPNWNGQMIKNIKIVLPPLSEQEQIITYLDNLQAKVDALKQLQTETAAELDALLPSVLDKAFKGEL